MKRVAITMIFCISCFSIFAFGNRDYVEFDESMILHQFETNSGMDIAILEDGSLFVSKEGAWIYTTEYFEQDFKENSYYTSNDCLFYGTENNSYPVLLNHFDDFSEYKTVKDLFYNVATQFWTSFTMQSPKNKTVTKYVDLMKSILDGTGDFDDNRFFLVTDPQDETNIVLGFESVDPSYNMVTSKASIQSNLLYFEKSDDLWFEADYYIESGMPFTIVDFESEFFIEHPGPRVVIRDGMLAIENKFAEKLEYSNDSGVYVPLQEWFTVKVHLKLSEDDTGIIELWQDNTLLISENGINLPMPNAILNIVEVGISASSEATFLYIDNLRISHESF